MIPPDLSTRRLQPELMDAPDLEEDRHVRALRALERVNVLSGTVGRIWREIRTLNKDRSAPLRVLDVACGGGDVVVSLKRRADRSGLPLEVHGSDRSTVALEHARGLARASGVDVEFFQQDALTEPLPQGYDLICSSLFLHHLTEDEAVALMRSMVAAAPAGFIQDLRRTRMGHALAFITLRTLARSDVAQVDGTRSVEGAFTVSEAAALASRAGIAQLEIRRCWPQRYTMSWRTA
jgi:2-polyprenyl-3-methyl-5-hydroxy-6-metoxy-1,4-benzoquinol methylase